jgi:hypothetical protein
MKRSVEEAKLDAEVEEGEEGEIGTNDSVATETSASAEHLSKKQKKKLLKKMVKGSASKDVILALSPNVSLPTISLSTFHFLLPTSCFSILLIRVPFFPDLPPHSKFTHPQATPSVRLNIPDVFAMAQDSKGQTISMQVTSFPLSRTCHHSKFHRWTFFISCRMCKIRACGCLEHPINT